jgi:hypothetical protein
VLNICADECKVFSTKERSPYYICLEIYRPEEEIEVKINVKNGLQRDFGSDYTWEYDKLLSEPIVVNDLDQIQQIRNPRKRSIEQFSSNGHGAQEGAPNSNAVGYIEKNNQNPANALQLNRASYTLEEEEV